MRTPCRIPAPLVIYEDGMIADFRCKYEDGHTGKCEWKQSSPCISRSSAAWSGVGNSEGWSRMSERAFFYLVMTALAIMLLAVFLALMTI